MKPIRIAPCTGLGLELRRGQTLTVIDPEGGQVADLFAFGRGDLDEWLSNGRTFDYNGTLRVTAGTVLYSNRSQPMFTVIEDTVGRHDFLFSPCSTEMFRIQYGRGDSPPNCLDNLSGALAEFGVGAARITVPLNVFMNTEVASDGTITIAPPRSRAGDRMTLRAEADLWVAVSACAAEVCNDHHQRPIDVVIDGFGAGADS